jgi:hypothetical protein
MAHAIVKDLDNSRSPGKSVRSVCIAEISNVPDKLETVIKDQRSGKVLTFRLQPEFQTKYLDTPEDRQAAAARDVLSLPDSAIFTIGEAAAKP